ncbi:MAG: hypothetical protein ABIP87_07730 [Thermomonas sp.]
MTKTTKLLTALLLAVCATNAFAQDAQKPDKIVLEQKTGSVMISNGGEYETADMGKVLIRNESMMLSDGAKATVVYYYDNGKRTCTEKYAGPNTYIIDDSCKVAAYMGGTDLAAVALITGAAVLGAVLIGSQDTVDYVPPPVSGSAR